MYNTLIYIYIYVYICNYIHAYIHVGWPRSLLQRRMPSPGTPDEGALAAIAL